MFCQKQSYNLVDKIQLRCLRTVQNNFSLKLEDLKNNNIIVPMHKLHLKTLLSEIYKVSQNIGPLFMQNLFVKQNIPYNLRTNNLLQLPSTRTVSNGINSVFFRGSLLWNRLPDDIKSTTTLINFKKKLSELDSYNCNCKICRF